MKNCLLMVGLSLMTLAAHAEEPLARFGLLADPQYTDHDPEIGRNYREGKNITKATLERFLLDHGVEAAAKIASIVSSSANLRIAYNELRKDFGATDGRAYLALVKEYKGAQQ